MTHGPRSDKNYNRKINRKMRVKALFAVLSKKLKDKELVFVDGISLSNAKTKEAKSVLRSLGRISGYEGLASKKKNAAFIGTFGRDEKLSRSFGNLGNILLDDVKNLNVVDALTYKYLIISSPEESVKFLSAKIK